MIPKKIHYFWFSNDPLPKKLSLCIDSWTEVLNDYEIIKWDLSNSPLEHPFAQKALKEKKWAFLTDYCRFKVLHEHGGIYIDSDVYIMQSLNGILGYDSFWSSTDFKKVDPFIFGTIRNNSVVAECIAFYDKLALDFDEYPVVPDVIGDIFRAKGYLGDNLEEFHFENNVIFPFEVFCPMPYNSSDDNDFQSYATSKTLAIHLWNTAWNDPFRFFYQNRRKSGWRAVRKTIRKNPFQPWSFYKNVLYHLKSGILGYPKLNK